MDAKEFFGDQWKYLLSMLPAAVDLDASARETGALVRPRVVRAAEDLLRLLLAYSCCGLSLRQASSWAAQQGLGEMSPVAVQKCLRRSADWLGQLLNAKLAERVGSDCLDTGGLRLVDATTVSAPGSQGTDWRLHVGFDLGAQSINSVEVTGAEGGESLGRFRLREREIVIADRGYCHRRGLWSVAQLGAQFIVRLNWQNLPLQTPSGEPFDLFEAFKQVTGTTASEFAVQTAATRDVPAMSARLVVLRKSPEMARKSRRKIIREARKKGKKVHPQTLKAARYFFVLTSVPASLLEVGQVLELYRYRWQIEMAFKRLKNVLPLRQVPAKDPTVARCYLFANLLAALLIEDLTRNFLALPPWGYRLRRPSS